MISTNPLVVAISDPPIKALTDLPTKTPRDQFTTDPVNPPKAFVVPSKDTNGDCNKVALCFGTNLAKIAGFLTF